jgi:hypothetical protein
MQKVPNHMDVLGSRVAATAGKNSFQAFKLMVVFDAGEFKS